jgi:hypothetical protein
MLIFIPWKPVVVVWCLLAAMLWVGYVAYSVLEGKNPFAMAQHNSYHAQRKSTPDKGADKNSIPYSR